MRTAGTSVYAIEKILIVAFVAVATVATVAIVGSIVQSIFLRAASMI